MTRAAFVADYAVPPVVMAQLDTYAALLAEWQARMNLVAASTLPGLWQRHMADSAQLAALVPDVNAATTWLDIGSGAGFPALVLALLAPGTFHLVEARAKKCAFLAAAVAELDLGDRVVLHNDRIEALPPFAADVVTARAAASLRQLFAWGLPFGHRARWLLPKGRSAATEVAAAAADFTFDHSLIASRTDPQARIVAARNVRRRRR